ncbi:hypothetical protein GWI33_006363 [Rhynchophorus ferrugineus]|uniref:Uncharacterized protein n=1 Tax=Rhynchophorus ferrugineus TaxID=354439 RepID=A0A834ITM1_RHYFE|nr:hypothetical protein GWI33_006363 [Rhynchophorus ferrugineus]
MNVAASFISGRLLLPLIPTPASESSLRPPDDGAATAACVFYSRHFVVDSDVLLPLLRESRGFETRNRPRKIHFLMVKTNGLFCLLLVFL